MKKRILYCILIFFIIPLASAIIVDDFNRADSGTLGTATNGQVWVESGEDASNKFEIFSNTLKISGNCGVSGYNAELNLGKTLNVSNDSIILEYDMTPNGWVSDVVNFYDTQGVTAGNFTVNDDAKQYYANGRTVSVMPYAGQVANDNFTFFFDFSLGKITFQNHSKSNFTYDMASPVKNISMIRIMGCATTSDGGGTSYLNSIHLNITNENAGTTPPDIIQNSYNMTSGSGEGCISWRTNKTSPCSTSDTTPTVKFNTNKNAFCAIGTSDLNYTDMGSSGNCTIGEGAASHICTLASQDDLFYENSAIYISCKDLNNNQNLTSSSGALSLNVTDLETTAKNSIEVGIANALISDYTAYTDQRVYARNSANNASIARFHKIAKKLNKIWAFSRIGLNDNYANMFNITPILYTFEFANLSSVKIENQTALLINATK